MESNTMFHQENQILLTVGSRKYTSVSMIELNWITSTSIFLQGLFLHYPHESIITIVCLQPSLLVPLYVDILRHLYKGISTVVSLLLSLLSSLRSEFLWSSLLLSLRSEFLRLSLLASLWNIFLWGLYKDIPTVRPIPSKSEMFV